MTKLTGLTSRKRSSAFVRNKPFRDAKILVIATEGEVTEKHYFSIFSDPQSEFFNPRVKRIDILQTENGFSAPAHVIHRLLDYKQNNDLNAQDQLWLVIDVDRWEKQGVLAPVIAEAYQKDIFLAISNPCFEVWLLCHFVDDLSVVTDFHASSKEHLGNVKCEFDLNKYIERVNHAVNVAEISDTGNDPHIPVPLGTKLHKLIKIILPTS
jgi:hypothetical protein